jgi:hypothetical protein
MSFLPTNSVLGELQIIKILDWYDGPRLFIAENTSGDRYVAFWADELESGSLWLYVAVSNDRIDSLLTSAIDLRQLYSDSEDGIVFKVFLHQDDHESSVQSVSISTLDEDFLPLSGDFITNQDSYSSETMSMR